MLSYSVKVWRFKLEEPIGAKPFEAISKIVAIVTIALI